MSIGVWVAFFGVLYTLGIPLAGMRIAREVNHSIQLGITNLPSQRAFRMIVGLFALGWPFLALYWIAVQVMVVYLRARGINISNDDDEPPPDAPSGAT